MDDHIEIERTTLEGRMAERHTSYNENGDKVIEFFTEEKRPLHLEKRIVQKHKTIVAEEVEETVKDGMVIERQIRSVDPAPQMQMREHIGVANHASVIDGDYATKEDVKEAIVAGISSLIENLEMNSMQAMSNKNVKSLAEEQISNRVEGKKDTKDSGINMLLVVMIIAQVAIVYWAFFM